MAEQKLCMIFVDMEKPRCVLKKGDLASTEKV